MADENVREELDALRQRIDELESKTDAAQTACDHLEHVHFSALVSRVEALEQKAKED